MDASYLTDVRIAKGLSGQPRPLFAQDTSRDGGHYGSVLPVDLTCAALPPLMDGQEAASLTLWNALKFHSKPHGAPHAATPSEYFSALWLITRLVRLHQASFMEHLPVQGRSPDDDTLRISRARIEALRVRERAFPIRSAVWLLEDWPDRFVAIAKRARITGEHFMRTQSNYPSWFLEVLLNHFMLRTTWIGRDEVIHAIDTIRNRGEQVSKNAIRRTLGITENKAINELLNQRRVATVDELIDLCRKFERLAEVTPPARDQQRVLVRDFLMLLISVFARQKIEDVCRMNDVEVGNIVTAGVRCNEIAPKAAVVASLLIRLHDQYAHGVRPFFIVRGDKPKVWFLSRFGTQLEGHSVRDQIAKLMQQDFDPSLWKSADVFRDALEGD
jgi:hypothetical protein